jgi:hypothetical protein
MHTFGKDYTARRFWRHVLNVIVALIIVGIIAWVANGIFVLKEIRVAGDPVLVSIDKERVGDNMLFLQTQKLEHDLLASYPLIQSVSFSKSFPSTLVVHVTLRKPYAQLVSQGHMYALDREGIVLADGTSLSGSPKLVFDAGILSIGSRVGDARVLGSLQLLTQLSDTVGIETIYEKDSATLQAVMGHTNIFFPQKGDFKVKADTLQTIVTGFRIKGTLPTVIDLRFDKPIITK